MPEQVRVTKIATLAESDPDSAVEITKFAVLAESEIIEQVRVTKFAVLAETDPLAEVRVSKLAVLREMSIFDPRPVPTAGNSVIEYNNTDITQYLRGWSLEANVNQTNTTNMASTDMESTAGSVRWRATLTAYRNQTLDDLIAPDVVMTPAADNLRQFKASFGFPETRVTYLWSNAAFVKKYRSRATVDDVIKCDIEVCLNGKPAYSYVVPNA